MHQQMVVRRAVQRRLCCACFRLCCACFRLLFAISHDALLARRAMAVRKRRGRRARLTRGPIVRPPMVRQAGETLL